MTHPSGHFSGHNISALKECCVLKFLQALETDQGYLAHTPTGSGVPTPKKKFHRENSKIWFKIQRVSLYNFHASKNILTKLLQET